MRRLAITLPLAPSTIGGTVPNVARLATPDPKEAAVMGAAGQTIDLDLGSVQNIDTLFLGYTSASNEAAPIAVSYGSLAHAETILAGDLPVAAGRDPDPRRHFVRVLELPVAARYIRLTPPAALTLGVVAVGLAFKSFWGHEWGAGRLIEDTGSADRLFGGGFGINEGVAASGYQWTFGDLTQDEEQTLWALVKRARTTRSILVVEDSDQTFGLHDRTHWGLFPRLEPYERLAPGATRWGFSVRGWA